MTATFSTTIDVREIAPRERHSLIFSRFDALQPKQALQLVSDHDPKPLHHQFRDRFFGKFEWAYLEAGPALWRVKISKPSAAVTQVAGGSCCSGGACGG